MRFTRLAILGLAAACAGQPGAAPVAPAPTPGTQRPAYTDADVHFMTGMITHHEQAVLIAGWGQSHGAGPAMLVMCERIIVSQNDEIAFMQRWLSERGLPVAAHHSMAMPGMLTAEQLAQLDAARSGEFERLFLTFMIQHHQGAITMVEQLFRSPGAAQDGEVFRFAADVSADQTAEIERMNRMLATLNP